MEAGPEAPPPDGPPRPSQAKREEQRDALARQWRQLTRAATFVAVLTSPALFVILYQRNGWRVVPAIVVSLAAVIAFRGLVDVVARKFIPSPSLYGADQQMAAEDIIAKRRAWYWRTRYRLLMWILLIVFVYCVGAFIVDYVQGDTFSLSNAVSDLWDAFISALQSIPTLGLTLVIFFLINLFILFGPLLFFGIQQIKGYEPGDADWGVKLEDVRGQKEAKEEIARVITLWQSGEDFEKAGGKRERGLLFFGSPGTGKTMLAKAIATNFNSPFVTIPGSGFAQTFIGMDVIIVRFMVRKAKRLARKWGGQCIIFIDEIDAVGLRRSTLGTGEFISAPKSIHDVSFYGPMGSFHPDGELLVERRAWRERLFEERAKQQDELRPPPMFPRIRNYIFPGGMGMGGGMALNQLLVVMDGVDDPPLLKRFFTNRINTFLDATYLMPQTIGGVSMRLPRPRPAPEQIFFIGATNVPINRLDPALLRPGRMGRHIWFRTPTKEDRKDIFDMYITKVAHVPELDTPRRRDEMARITHGYSPAMIEQVCSMALTYAHADGRFAFEWRDLVEAMTTVESGTAIGTEYIPEETREVAIHEAGHAVASHIFLNDHLSTRLSIKRRGGSLGHHQAIQEEERFLDWKKDAFGDIIWALGAMAAETVFYDQNSTGVSGDLHAATTKAAMMVGVWGMGPERIELPDLNRHDVPRVRKAVDKNFEDLGTRIMNRASAFVGEVMGDKDKRRTVAVLLGQAYFTAYQTMKQNRRAVEYIADELIEKRELHGDEVVDLLDRAGITRPKLDYVDPMSWPKI